MTLAPTPSLLTGLSAGSTIYGLRALEQEAREVEAAPEGTRNDTLNRAAFATGQLVAGRELEQASSENRLIEAALKAGLSETEARATLKSGLEKGKLEPRSGKTNGHVADARAAVNEMPAAESWKWLDASDILAPRPPRGWVVENLLRPKSLNALYGASGTLKSMLLMDLCASIAIGRPWLPGLSDGAVEPFKTHKTTPLWINIDQPYDELQERFAAFFAHYGNNPANGNIRHVTFPSPAFLAENEEVVLGVADAALGMQSKLIVIDCLKMSLGGLDENSGFVSVAMLNLRRLAEISGAAVVLIHHARKANGSEGRKGDSLRGHTAIEASLDLALRMERDEKTEEAFTIVPTKVRSAPVQRFGGLFTFEHRPGTYELETAAMYGMPVGTSVRQVTAQAKAAALKALEHGEMTKTLLGQKVKEATGLGIVQISQAIDALEAGGSIQRKPTSDARRKVYSLP